MFRTSSQPRVKSKTRKKWRLLNATDFQSLMRPCFLICRILGTFPYNTNGSTFQFSKWRHTLSTVMMFILCCNLIQLYYDIYITHKIKFSNVPHYLHGSCYFLFGGFIAIVTYILSGPRMRLLQTMVEVSSKVPQESYEKMSKFIHVKDISLIFLIIVQVPQFHFGNINDYLFYLPGMYITLVAFYMDMLYMNCVCVLKAYFQKINDSVANLRKIAMNDEPHFLEQSYNQRNSYLLMELKALKKQHLIVSDTVQKLNLIFSLQLLATVTMTFTEITFNLYYLTQKIYDNIKIYPLEKLIFDKVILTPIFYYAIKIGLIIWSCETGKTRAMKITTTVHDVLVSTNDKEVKNELQLFSLQILHRDNTFSARGLTMDATLLTAVAGSITTYLLILVQFMNAANICDKKPSNNVTSSV